MVSAPKPGARGRSKPDQERQLRLQIRSRRQRRCVAPGIRQRHRGIVLGLSLSTRPGPASTIIHQSQTRYGREDRPEIRRRHNSSPSTQSVRPPPDLDHLAFDENGPHDSSIRDRGEHKIQQCRHRGCAPWTDVEIDAASRSRNWTRGWSYSDAESCEWGMDSSDRGLFLKHRNLFAHVDRR